MKEFLFPIKIVESKCASGTDMLLKKQPLQIGTSESCFAEFDCGDYVILDFGKEMCGGARILTYHSKAPRVRLRFGESLGECCSDIGGEKNATNDHSLRDFEVSLSSLSDMTFGNTGFRFLRIDFFGFARIKSIVACNEILKRKEIYTYEGEDALISDIFCTAKRTVDLCASSGYIWDGVKRDRLVWIGDMHPEMLALTTLYGRMPEIERSLDFVREQTPLPAWMNGYPMYSMWWIIILADYYAKTSARAFIMRQLCYLERLVEQMNCCVKENGELDYPSYFVDWPTHGQPDELDGVRAINIIATKKAIALLEEFGRDSATARELLRRLLLIDIMPQTSKQVTALKYFATELTEDDKMRLVEGGAKGMSTFMSYYILKAVASFDRESAISMMKEYYGAMLGKGATTFWEDFDIAWCENSCRIDELATAGQKDIHGDFGAFCYIGFRHSLCHGWSAGVVQFIKEECN
ncbi:MAG: alpha-L-rhamnosidase [Clostridia bacterium]|nr:alpha-L-rhamnosidase [Clostridia bacterium]